MRLVLSFVALACLARPSLAQESCAVCHGELAVAERHAAHAQAGIQCIDCHGGVAGALDVAQAHGDDLRRPEGPRAGVALCGGCHSDAERMHGFGARTDQLLLYSSSRHGLRLAEADDPNVATCITCHGAHGVLSADDPRSPAHPRRQPETCGACHANAELMASYELSADPPRLYGASVHGKAVLEQGSHASPSCTTCHGAHGAAPPRVQDVGRVCGGCHSKALQHFEASAHLDAVRDGRMEECISCHGSHAVAKPSVDMLVGSGVGHCGSCHAESPESAAVGARLHESLSAFDSRLLAAEDALSSAAQRGVFVEHASAFLRDARALRHRAAPVVHALSPQSLDDVLERGRGLLAEAFDGLGREERGLRDRRIFVGAFLLVDLLLAAVLWIHARGVAEHASGRQGAYEPERSSPGWDDRA